MRSLQAIILVALTTTNGLLGVAAVDLTTFVSPNVNFFAISLSFCQESY